MSFLPGVGTVSYNGYTFDGSMKSRINARFVYDQAERTVVYVIYTIDVTVIIVNSGASTDTPMDNLRNRLSKPGQCLQFSTTGLGTMNVNCSLGAPGSALDVVWGPKPRTLEMESIGSSQAWRVRWVCDVAIPQCSNAKYSGFPVAFNYELTYSIGEDGLTTRTYEGYVEIPISRRPNDPSGRAIADSADAYRFDINPPLIPGFRRKPGDFRLSGDRRTLRFTIIDIETPPDGTPVYCTNAGGEHSIRTEIMNTFQFSGTISAHYTVSPQEPKTRAWEMFYLLLLDRLSAAQQIANLQNEGQFRVTNLELTEGLYADGLQMSFSVTYIFFSTADRFLIASGMWRAMVGTDWTDYAESVRAVLNERGSAGLFYSKEDDAIIDLCLNNNAPPISPNTTNIMRSAPIPDSIFGSEVTPNTSWVRVQTSAKTTADPGTCVMKSLPGQSISTNGSPLGGVQVMRSNPNPALPPSQINTGPGGTPGIDFPIAVLEDGTEIWPDSEDNTGNQGPVFKPSVARPSGSGSSGSGGSSSTATPGDTTAQQRVQPTYRIRLIGQAIRVGYRIPPPILKTINGAKCIPDGEHQFVEAIIGNWFGLPIFAAAWNIPYVLVGDASGRVSVPINPHCSGISVD